MIKDSGDRTEFSTGAVRDMHKGKGDFTLLPMWAIWKLARHCERGANKYGRNNVDRGIPVSSLIDSAMRHLTKYILGWEDEDHLTAAAWNIMFALQMTGTHPEMVDIPWEGARYFARCKDCALFGNKVLPDTAEITAYCHYKQAPEFGDQPACLDFVLSNFSDRKGGNNTNE